MKLTYNKIIELANKAIAHEKWEVKKEAVISIAGCKLLPVQDITSESQMKQLMDGDCQAVVILCSPDDLLDNGTVCGSVPNTCFTPKVVDYLKSKNVSEIFCAVVYDHSSGFLISGAEMNIWNKYSTKLSNLVAEAGGSWRNDVGTERGWCSFESE